MLVKMCSAQERGLIRGVAEYAQRHTDWSMRLEEAGPGHWARLHKPFTVQFEKYDLDFQLTTVSNNSEKQSHYGRVHQNICHFAAWLVCSIGEARK